MTGPIPPRSVQIIQITVMGEQMEARLHGTEQQIRDMLELDSTASLTDAKGREAIKRYAQDLEKFLDAQILANAELRTALGVERASPSDIADRLEGAQLDHQEIRLLPQARADEKTIRWTALTEDAPLAPTTGKVQELADRVWPGAKQWLSESTHRSWRPGLASVSTGPAGAPGTSSDPHALAEQRARVQQWEDEFPFGHLPDALNTSASAAPGAGARGVVAVERKGIPNFGNTCYFNSALQLLFEIPGWDGIVNGFERGAAAPEADFWKRRADKQPTKAKFVEALRALKNAARGGPLADLQPHVDTILQILAEKNPGQFGERGQHDAGEAAMALLDLLGGSPEHLALRRPAEWIKPVKYRLLEGGEEIPGPVVVNDETQAVFLEFAVRRAWDPSKNRVNFPCPDHDRKPFQVQALICHQGVEVTAGHYVTLIRTYKNGSEGWQLMNDQEVRSLSEANAAPYLRQVKAVLYTPIPS
jgi:hypothetical protein